MKIALIGGSSFICQNLISYIQHNKSLSKNLSFIIFDEIKKKSLYKIVPYLYPGSKLDYGLLFESDVIINFTAMGLNGVDSKNKNLLYEINLYEPIRMANALEKNKYKGKIISFGSSHEIGKTMSNEKFNEEQILNSTYKCLNDYGVSKRLLTKFISNSTNLDWTHLILPNIYGINFEPEHRIIPYLLKCINTNISPIIKNINNNRQFLNVLDLCDLLTKIILSNTSFSGIYNVAPDESLTIKELILIIERVYNKKFTRRNELLKNEDNGDSLLLNNKKLIKTASWKPKKLINDYIIMNKKLRF